MNNYIFDIINKNIVIYETKDGINFIIKDFNKFAEKTEKIKKKDIIGKNVVNVFPGIVEFGLLEVFKEVYKTGKTKNFPLKIYKDNRILGWRENNIHKLPTGEIIAIYDDLTEIKKLEKALKESEEQFRSFFENNQAVILKINSTTRKITECNKAAINYYGYTKEELKSKTIDELNTLSIEEIKKKMKIAVKKKSNFFQFKHKLKNGEIRDIELYASPVKTNNEIFLFSLIHDITDRIKSQKANIEIQRLGAIGEMTSSIAHDFNNSLQAISGNIELCIHEQTDIKPELISKLEIIQSTIKDASTRVKSLLKFSGQKNDQTPKENISLNNILDNIILQSRPLWKDMTEKNGLKIEIIKNYKEKFYINGNKGLLSSAFFNILKNAVEAMPYGGKIIFSLDKIKDEIYLTIKDTGIGMSEKTKMRIFQPFFTTKGPELGRGLGMSGAYTIINEHSGRISIKESEINSGTTIEIIFPSLNTIELCTKAQKNESNNNFNQKKLKILWVDDDYVISTIAKKYIKVLNHTGDVVTSGKDAIELLKKEKYDILITDIGMPEMNGWQLIKEVREVLKNKQIKIILLSGWRIENNKDLKLYNISTVLQKPIMLNNLKNILN